ncbi:MAG TPA: hypothetical protein VGA69_08935 [Nitriliruptorales bacterium]
MLTADLTIADEWPGAWEVIAWSRPDDWREVARLVRWDVAIVGAAWVHLEAAAESAADQAEIRSEVAELAAVLAADLPFFLGVSPSMPDADLQPQLPLVLPDDPPLEPLRERPDDLSWRMYFWMVMREHVELIVERAQPLLRARGLAVEAASSPGTEDDVLEGWMATRARRLRDLCERLAEQVAFQVEWVLRSQTPALVALLEESLAVRVDDAALGAALHVERDRAGAPVALRLVSHDGRPRGAVRTRGRAGASLQTLLRNVAR